MNQIELPNWTPEPLQHAWGFLNTWPIVAAGLIIVLFWLLAHIVGFLFKRSMVKLTAQTENDYDDRLVDALKRPLFFTVLCIGLVLATHTIGLPDSVESVTKNLLQTILILVWAKAALGVSKVLLDFFGGESRFRLFEPRTIPLFEITSKVMLFAIAGYMVLKVWGIDATAWLASAGVVGIALGFAAKDTLANLFSGFFIVADSPYQIGDYIVLDAGERGKVTHVGIRSTRILTRDDHEITLPNAVIAAGKIINENAGPSTKARLKMSVGVAYGTDLHKACDLLNNIAAQHKDICDNPAPRTHIHGFGASSLDLYVKCWISDPAIRGRVTHELMLSIYDALNEANIEIPYAKQDLYIKEFPNLPQATAKAN